ncbi:MAG: hypothetical protein FWF08_01870 [Oscillospiraceae bacterium]|nr:hypothetical protein [Oscillospiraceae bacterium]
MLKKAAIIILIIITVFYAALCLLLSDSRASGFVSVPAAIKMIVLNKDYVKFANSPQRYLLWRDRQADIGIAFDENDGPWKGYMGDIIINGEEYHWTAGGFTRLFNIFTLIPMEEYRQR